MVIRASCVINLPKSKPLYVRLSSFIVSSSFLFATRFRYISLYWTRTWSPELLFDCCAGFWNLIQFYVNSRVGKKVQKSLVQQKLMMILVMIKWWSLSLVKLVAPAALRFACTNLAPADHHRHNPYQRHIHTHHHHLHHPQSPPSSTKASLQSPLAPVILPSKIIIIII